VPLWNHILFEGILWFSADSTPITVVVVIVTDAVVVVVVVVMVTIATAAAVVMVVAVKTIIAVAIGVADPQTCANSLDSNAFVSGNLLKLNNVLQSH
jgi:hypothetical protein